jgi:hypothetical protein
MSIQSDLSRRSYVGAVLDLYARQKCWPTKFRRRPVYVRAMWD